MPPLLKAQYNRVRTSNALKSNDIWDKAIGLESDVGGNSAIEAALPAPGGKSFQKAERQAKAQELITASGFKQNVTSYEGLMSLAKSQGLANNEKRGACKICGGLGHLTKQCRNGVSGHTGTMDDLEMEAARAARVASVAATDDLSSLDSMSSSSSDDSSDSDSDSGRDRKRKHKSSKSKKSKSSKKESKDKDSKKDKDKKRKRDKKEKKKSKKSKKSRREDRSSDSD